MKLSCYVFRRDQLSMECALSKAARTEAVPRPAQLTGALADEFGALRQFGPYRSPYLAGGDPALSAPLWLLPVLIAGVPGTLHALQWVVSLSLESVVYARWV